MKPILVLYISVTILQYMTVCYNRYMRKIGYSFLIEPDTLENLKEVSQHNNENVSEMIRSAIDETYFTPFHVKFTYTDLEQKLLGYLNDFGISQSDFLHIAVMDWFNRNIPSKIYEKLIE